MKDTNTKRRRRLIVPLAVAALASTGLAVLGSGAFFGWRGSIPGNQFSVGTVELDLTSPQTLPINITNAAPGDAVVAEVRVENTGSLAARYSVQTTSVRPLDPPRSQEGVRELMMKLEISAKTGVTDCTVAGFDADGTLIGGPEPLMRQESETFYVNATTVFGDNAWGQDPGDRSLSAGTNETLCFKVELPPEPDEYWTTDGMQGEGAEWGLIFYAEQIKNNP